jgi:hypothetical protein
MKLFVSPCSDHLSLFSLDFRQRTLCHQPMQSVPRSFDPLLLLQRPQTPLLSSPILFAVTPTASAIDVPIHAAPPVTTMAANMKVRNTKVRDSTNFAPEKQKRTCALSIAVPLLGLRTAG